MERARQAAKIYGVPRTCLQRRIEGKVGFKIVRNHTYFTDEVGRELIQRIVKMSEYGFDLTIDDLRKVAYQFA